MVDVFKIILCRVVLYCIALYCIVLYCSILAPSQDLPYFDAVARGEAARQ